MHCRVPQFTALAVLLFSSLLFIIPSAVADQIERITEVSGIVRSGDRLLMVSDDEPGCYFELKITDQSATIIPIDPKQLKRVTLKGCEAVSDLESITVLSDGRVAVLSEDLHALFGPATLGAKRCGIIALFGQEVTEFGNRGVEGVATLSLPNGLSRIAVVWEGGYPVFTSLPSQIQHSLGHSPLEPILVIMEIPRNGSALTANDSTEYRLLRTPGGTGAGNGDSDPQLIQAELPKSRQPADESVPPFAQRFRVPDLVWHIQTNDATTDTGLIVLLTSENAPLRGSGVKREFKHKLLQRYNVSGRPVGEAIDINSLVKPIFANLTPVQSRSWTVESRSHFVKIRALLDEQNWENVNWEGLGWFVKGKSLILIYDGVPADPPFAVVIPIPDDWK